MLFVCEERLFNIKWENVYDIQVWKRKEQVYYSFYKDKIFHSFSAPYLWLMVIYLGLGCLQLKVLYLLEPFKVASILLKGQLYSLPVFTQCSLIKQRSAIKIYVIFQLISHCEFGIGIDFCHNATACAIFVFNSCRTRLRSQKYGQMEQILLVSNLQRSYTI